MDGRSERASRGGSLGHFVKTNDETLERLAKWVPVTSKDVVLDIGCGDGGLIVGLAKSTGCRGVGVEVDAELYGKAQEKVREEGFDERRLKLYGKPIEEVPLEDLLDIHRVTLVYIYALFVGQNRTVIALLQQLLVRGIIVVTSTFELPVSEVGGFSKIWPDPDTPDGLLELACPSCTTKLHLYRGETCLGELENRRMALDLVRHNASRLKDISMRFRGDREIVLAAVITNGWLLPYASEDLRDDMQVVRAAVNRTPRAIKYASLRVKQDVELAEQVVRRDGSLLMYFPKQIQKMEVCAAAMECSERAVRYVGSRVTRRMRQREGMIILPSHVRGLRDHAPDAIGPRSRLLRPAGARAGSLPPDEFEVLPGPQDCEGLDVGGPRPLPKEPEEEELGQEEQSAKTAGRSSCKASGEARIGPELPRRPDSWEEQIGLLGLGRPQDSAQLEQPRQRVSPEQVRDVLDQLFRSGQDRPQELPPRAQERPPGPQEAPPRQPSRPQPQSPRRPPSPPTLPTKSGWPPGPSAQPAPPAVKAGGGGAAPAAPAAEEQAALDEPEQEPEEEEPAIEPEAQPDQPGEEDLEPNEPFLPGEETWTCTSCEDYSGVRSSPDKCWHCGEVRGQGHIAITWGKLERGVDERRRGVRGVLCDGTVHTDDGYQLPTSLGGRELLRRCPPSGGAECAQEVPALPPGDASAEAAEGEAEEEWEVLSAWEFWHHKKDDSLILYDREQEEYPTTPFTRTRR